MKFYPLYYENMGKSFVYSPVVWQYRGLTGTVVGINGVWNNLGLGRVSGFLNFLDYKTFGKPSTNHMN